MIIKDLLNEAVDRKASDLHLLPDISPTLRIDGLLTIISNYPILTIEEIEQMIFSLINPEQKEFLLTNKEIDFSIDFTGDGNESRGRFRVNAYYQRGKLSAVLRLINSTIQTVEELNLPKIISSFATLRQGLVLICGPTGHGKSTTLAAIINEINKTRSAHIVTIEDPIEYTYPLGKSIFSQREMGIDTHSWSVALRSALREDPDIIVIGEMRDSNTMESAMTLAETGHLVFSTIHTNSAAQSIDRIVDSFSGSQQNQIRAQLASVIMGIVSQRLVPKIIGGRIPAVGILIGTSAIATNIKEGNTNLIDSIIQTSSKDGMISLDASLAKLVYNGEISFDTAKNYSLNNDELSRLLS